jgi:hypothetical protein
MAVEARRGCGYRKIGGIYLVSEGGGMGCDRLPISLTVCPVCSHGFKQSRGFTWVDVAGLVGGVHKECMDNDLDDFPCPLCMETEKMGKAGMLWIGEQFYPTPESFDREGATMGFSRRIHAVPRNFKVGETWILLAHPNGHNIPCETCEHSGLVLEDELASLCPDCKGAGRKVAAAIFKVWRPSRIEKILAESKRGTDEVKDLEEKGITVVFVPDDDPDHKGSVYDDDEDNEPPMFSQAVN